MISGKTQYYNSLKAQQSLPSEMLVSQNPGENNVKTALIRPLPKIEPEVLKNFKENKQFPKENGFIKNGGCEIKSDNAKIPSCRNSDTEIHELSEDHSKTTPVFSDHQSELSQETRRNSVKSNLSSPSLYDCEKFGGEETPKHLQKFCKVYGYF